MEQLCAANTIMVLLLGGAIGLVAGVVTIAWKPVRSGHGRCLLAHDGKHTPPAETRQ